MLSIEGHICECSSSNIFWVKDGMLYTPSLESGILAGTTRDSIIQLWHGGVTEGVFSIDDLKNADEVFVTNVVWIAKPVKRLMPANNVYKNFDFCSKVLEMLEKTDAIILSYIQVLFRFNYNGFTY